MPVCGIFFTLIVPDSCTTQGEIRSFSHEEALVCLREIEKSVEQITGQYQAVGTVSHTIHLVVYQTPESSNSVRMFQTACKKLGLPGKLVSTFGGSDHNSFAEHGIGGLVLSCGMEKVHSVQEYIEEEQLQKGVDLVAELICQKGEEKPCCLPISRRC